MASVKKLKYLFGLKQANISEVEQRQRAPSLPLCMFPVQVIGISKIS